MILVNVNLVLIMYLVFYNQVPRLPENKTTQLLLNNFLNETIFFLSI